MLLHNLPRYDMTFITYLLYVVANIEHFNNAWLLRNVINGQIVVAGVVGTCRLTAYSFVAIRLFVGLIVFTPGTQLSICILLISAISEQWIYLSAPI